MQTRQKTRRRQWLIISSATVLILALLSGAVFFLLPKITAASINQPMLSTGQGSNTANTLNSTAKNGNASNANTTNNTGQVAAQPTQAAPTTTTQGSNTGAMGNGNTTTTQPVPPTTANNGNQASAPAAPQNPTVSIVTLKQYVPDIRHMVAQSLDITDKALALQLQNGMHLKDIAMLHGLSNTQLQNLLSTSISTGFQPAINAGNLTQTQVSTFIQQTQTNPTVLEQQLSILPAPVAHW